ncbi:MFS transporter [Terriglobus aquaticus]|uniref:MFS transporter n=1 Tax=Terriglobus aquaticus TaxID=940139 RepID=A0ABW9KQV1_9BACT|nr:MFS transporter [Terriglobus aquaticus]
MSAAEPRQPGAQSAFASPSFRNYQVARFLVILGAEAQSVAVAWQIYQLTHSALLLGSTGLALFLPSILFVLPAGHTADRYDRKRVILTCYGLQLVCSAALFAISYMGLRSIITIYVLLFFIGVGRAFSGPAASAILPQLVPKESFVNAMTWGSAVFQTANISGPALGGLLFTIALHGQAARLNGAPLVYLVTIVMLVGFLGLVSTLQPRREATEKKAFTLEAMLVGMRYVKQARLLLGSISLDMFAVLLGGAVSLMPIFAQDILHAGARGLGVLRAAPAVGALIMSVTLAKFPIKRNAGKLMLVCVGIFGAATVGFGLSKSIPFSLVMLVIIGATDNVSVIVRSSILQLGTPPQMRGRVSAVNAIFLGTSNEFGEFESGVTAQWLGAVRAVVLGGIGSMMVTGLWAVFFPPLRKVNTLTTEELLAANATSVSEPIN